MDGKLKTLSLLPFYKLTSTCRKIFIYFYLIESRSIELNQSQESRAPKELPYFHVLFFNYNWLKLLEKEPKMKAEI